MKLSVDEALEGDIQPDERWMRQAIWTLREETRKARAAQDKAEADNVGFRLLLGKILVTMKGTTFDELPALVASAMQSRYVGLVQCPKCNGAEALLRGDGVVVLKQPYTQFRVCELCRK